MNRESRPENNGYTGIRDITKLAGVSIAAVSYAINNPEITSEKVRKKVQKVIEEYNCVPNQPIKRIFSKTNNTTTVFIYDTENPFFISLVKKLDQICLERNYMPLTYDTGSSPELKKKYLYFCLTSRCTGITLTEGVDFDILEVCRTHTPTAFLSRKTHDKFSSIRSNNRQMMQPTVDYLYNLGHRKVASTGCKTSMDSVISRQNGYIETMAGKGSPIIQEYIYDKNLQLTPQVGSQALNYFLSLPTVPTAIIYCSDITALEALNVVYSLGLKIPADMSIVRPDNIISSLHQPRITTVQQNPRDISLKLFELVVNPPEKPVSKIIEASFIEGATYNRIETP